MKKNAVLFPLILTTAMIITGCASADTEIELFPQGIQTVEVSHSYASEETTWKLSQSDIEDMKDWASALKLEQKTFDDGEAPNEVYAGGESYTFNINNGETTFSYISIDDNYIYMDNNWYEVKNPSIPPAREPEQEENDKIPMVMVNGNLYYDTGKESSMDTRCGVMDGKITSSVDSSKIPAENNQSNFGEGYEYQYGAEGTIEILIDGKWIVFEQREGCGSQVRFGDRMIDKEGLSEETLKWLEWHNSLTEEEQMKVDYIPAELYKYAVSAETEDADTAAQTDSYDLCSYPRAEDMN